MASILNIKGFFKLILFLIPFLSVAQTTTYTFKSTKLIPGKKIKNLLDENTKTCFDNTDINTWKMQQHIKFYSQNDSLKVVLTTSPKVITDVQVEWETLNIKGVFEYKNNLIVVEADKDATPIFERFFKQKSDFISYTIELDDFGEPSCSTFYFIGNEKLVFLHKSFMF